MARKTSRKTKQPAGHVAAVKPARRPPIEPQSAWRRRLNGIKQNGLARFIVLWSISSAILLALFLRTVLRNDAYLEIFPSELLLPILMHIGTGLLITAALFWLPWLRPFLARQIAVVVLSFSIISYDTNLQAAAGAIKAFTPGLTSDDALPLVSAIYLLILITIAVIAGWGAARLAAKNRFVTVRDLQLGIAVIAIYLCAVPTLGVVRFLPAMIRQSQVTAPLFTQPNGQKPADSKPDIYYIVLDRYTNSNVLHDQFAYDNTPFTGFLRDSGFTVHDDAYANYPYTAMSVASTINGAYLNKQVEPFKQDEMQSRTLYHNLAQQSAAIKALKAGGYTYHTVGSWYGTSYDSPLADAQYTPTHKLTVFGKSITLHGIEATQFANSPYYRFAQLSTVVSRWPASTDDVDHAGLIPRQLQALRTLSTAPSGGRLIFAHLLIPHDPFVYNGDSSLSAYPGADNTGKPIKQKYTAQVDFINTEMRQLIADIDTNSNGTAVILLNADEGPHPDVLNATNSVISKADDMAGKNTGPDMSQWDEADLRMKFGILQAARIPRATEEDLAHLSSVNLFRIVLNRYGGYSLPYLPDCHYGLINGARNEYQYGDISGRLVTDPDPKCAETHSLPTTK